MTYQERKYKAIGILIPTLRQLARIYDINPATIAEKAGAIIEDAEASYQDRPQHLQTQQQDDSSLDKAKQVVADYDKAISKLERLG